MLLEKDRICMENTGNTTAKITAQHGLIYSKLLKGSDTETAQKYLRANLAALDRYAQMSKTVACDFERKDNYVYADDRKKLENEMYALRKIGYPAEFVETLPLPVNAAGAVKFPNQAQFDPIKFLSGIVGGLNIYENTFVRDVSGKTAVTNRGKIVADKIVCATHFPFINRHGGYFLKLYQDRSYVIALSDAPDVGGMYVDEAAEGLSFRNYNGLLFLGGSGGRTGKDHGNWQRLRRFAKEHYPQAKEKYFWAAQDCMSLDSVPYIGQYSKRTPELYVETGFNKWGMTSSMVSAMLVSDAILGRENEFSGVFCPSRSILKPQLLLNCFEAAANLLIPSKKRCPHMGCSMKWNKAEHTWDCPCHGSRFSRDGAVLNNPANGDIRQ